MRVLAQPIYFEHRRVGTLRIANPLTPVAQAQSSLLRTFALVGVLAVLLAAVAGVGLATLIAAPLRRITAVAAAATAGDLSKQAERRSVDDVPVLVDRAQARKSGRGSSEWRGFSRGGACAD